MTRTQRWIAGWIDIACGICCVISFARYNPIWYIDYAVHCAIKNTEKLK